MRFWLVGLLALIAFAYAAEIGSGEDIRVILQKASEDIEEEIDEPALLLLAIHDDLLEPLFHALGHDISLADDHQVMRFVLNLFNLVESIDAQQVHDYISPSLSANLMVAFCAVLPVHMALSPSYRAVCQRLGANVAKFREVLDLCVNWLLLLIRPQSNHIPAFLLVGDLVPDEVCDYFYSNYMKCIGCGKPFTYMGFVRMSKSAAPLNTTLFLLSLCGATALQDPKLKIVFGAADALELMQRATDTDPEDDVITNDFSILIQSSICATLHRFGNRENFFKVLAAFTFTKGMVKFLATAYQRGLQAQDIYLTSLVQQHSDSQMLKFLESLLSKLGKEPHELFIKAVMAMLLGKVQTPKTKWLQVSSMLRGDSMPSRGGADDWIDAICATLRMLISTKQYMRQEQPWLTKETRRMWIKSFDTLMGLKMIKDLEYTDVVISNPKQMKLLFLVFLLYSYEYIDKLLVCSLVATYGLSYETNALGLADILPVGLNPHTIFTSCCLFSSCPRIAPNVAKACQILMPLANADLADWSASEWQFYLLASGVNLFHSLQRQKKGAPGNDPWLEYEKAPCFSNAANTQSMTAHLIAQLSEPYHTEELRRSREGGLLARYYEFVRKRRVLSCAQQMQLQSLLEDDSTW